MNLPGSETSDLIDPGWKSLYRVGGIAPLVAFAFYLVEMFVAILGGPFPATTADWFMLIQRNKILGLLYLNALDIFSITLIGTMYLALYVALRRSNPSLTATAAFFAFLGVAVFIAPRVAMLGVVPLSDQYAAATSQEQQAIYLAAGTALSALGVPTPETIGFLFMAVAGLILSIVILQAGIFKKAVAYLGILAGLVTFLNDIFAIIAPGAAGMLVPINGLLWLIWWLLVSWGLVQLSRDIPKRST